eukprot:3790463-Rhodomonas_salina.1
MPASQSHYFSARLPPHSPSATAWQPRPQNTHRIRPVVSAAHVGVSHHHHCEGRRVGQSHQCACWRVAESHQCACRCAAQSHQCAEYG